MSSVIPFNGKTPKISPKVFIAEGARIIGDVEIDEYSSVWFNVVIRGDIYPVRIGARTNIQDNAVLHVTANRYSVHVGSNVTVGHSAILHGCTVGDNCLIGMGAILLDDVRVARNSIVAAGSLLLEHFEVPEGSLVAGSPGTVRRTLSAEEKNSLARSAQNYVDYAHDYRAR